MNNISENLKSLLSQRNLNAADISMNTNINQDIIYSIVSGTNSNPTINTLIAIADYLQVSIDYLINDNSI